MAYLSTAWRRSLIVAGALGASLAIIVPTTLAAGSDDGRDTPLARTEPTELNRRSGRIEPTAPPATKAKPLPTPAPLPPELLAGGRWGPVEEWPLISIHSVLTAEGDIITYGTDEAGIQTGRFSYDVWSPSPAAGSGHLTMQNTTQTDLFCNLQLNRADTGEVLLLGGDNWTGTNTTNTGNPDIVSYDPITDTLSSLPGMNRPRWYGTGTTLSDGSIYIQGGLGGEDRAEHWTPEGGAALLPFPTDQLDYWYPRNFVLPDGRLFGYDMIGRMYFVSPDLQEMAAAGHLPVDGHFKGSTGVMYEPGKIIQFGGRTTQVLLIDVTGPEPIVTEGAPMRSKRQWVNGTLLPDGRVLATGGAVKDAQEFTNDPIETYEATSEAEIWDPATGSWTVGSSAAVPRLYHSTAILLPDGRVLTGGGGAPGPVTATSAEIYSPDYLVQTDGSATPRLVIDGLSATEVSAGADLSIRIDDPSVVKRVTLVKTGAVTHSFDMDQRFIEVDFETAAGSVDITLPSNNAVLTPGFYLVTVLDRHGIPSESHMIKVTS